MYDKEQVYDEQISPLMAQIIEICKREEIPMAVQFYLKEKHGDNGEPLYCKTVLIPEKKKILPEAHDQMAKLYEIMKYGPDGKPFVMAATIRRL